MVSTHLERVFSYILNQLSTYATKLIATFDLILQLLGPQNTKIRPHNMSVKIIQAGYTISEFVVRIGDKDKKTSSSHLFTNLEPIFFTTFVDS